MRTAAPKEPYHNSAGEPILASSVVVLADILGFKSRISQAFHDGSQQTILHELASTLSYAHQIVDDPSGAKWVLKVFSDNLLVAYPFLGREPTGAVEFAMACFGMCHFQLQMVRNGLFVRGAIGVGDIHVSRDLVFGQIMADLSEAEPTALYPRIMLLESAVEHFESSASLKEDPSLGRLLWRHRETPFVSYLYPLDAFHDGQREEIMLQHKHTVELNMARFGENSRVLEKYLWVAQYHNEFCRNSRCFTEPRFQIDLG